MPAALEKKAVPGVRVLVPFGRGNRKTVALVTETNCGGQENETGLKRISAVIDDEPLVNGEALFLIERLSQTVFCTRFDIYRSMTPAGLNYRIKTRYAPANAETDFTEFSEEELSLYRRIASSDEPLSEDDPDLKGAKAKRILASLEDKGAIEEIFSYKRMVGDKTEKIARLTDGYVSSPESFALSAKQKEAVKILSGADSASVSEICYMAGCTKTVIKRLSEKGVITLYDSQVFRKAAGEVSERRSPEDIVLNAEQTAAFNGITELIKSGRPCGALLCGVTGSGKTAVFFRLIDVVLKMGATALMLVPEISLTPQMVKKFRIYFGDEIAVLHSSLSLGQRADEFKRIKLKKAKIVIGTRSAVFAPLENIGIIIMDEEGERTYKSDSAPRYHARDVAIQRCGWHNCPLLMASATPSIETFYFAKTGRFSLFELKNRYCGFPLPEVEIVDMQNESLCGNGSVFSRRLYSGLSETLRKGEQAILLLNRRGYSTYVSCADCRQPVSCPNCALPLTYHKKNERLMCHYCGYSQAVPEVCPRCKGGRIKRSGVGTQRIEDELSGLFPEARLLRMDTDTTFSRGAYEENFSAFERGEYDIMLGTQMIAKGLDFPGVTLVGVVSVDKALFTGDFRSYERTFSLITQVAGRSGRGNKPGKALIQTFVPDHYVINLAAAQNYGEFYEQESALRKALLFPPYCDICAVNLSSVMESAVIEASDRFVRLLMEYIEKNEVRIPLRVIGPAPCALGKINNRFRYRIIIKCRLSAEFYLMIRSCLISFMSDGKYREVRINADINGDIGL